MQLLAYHMYIILDSETPTSWPLKQLEETQLYGEIDIIIIKLMTKIASSVIRLFKPSTKAMLGCFIQTPHVIRVRNIC